MPNTARGRTPGQRFFPARTDRLDALLLALREKCSRIGRNPDEIEWTTRTPEMSTDGIKSMTDIGISSLVMTPPGHDAADVPRGWEASAESVMRHV